MKYHELAPGLRVYPRALPNPQLLIEKSLEDSSRWAESATGSQRAGDNKVRDHIRRSMSYAPPRDDADWAVARGRIMSAANHYHDHYRTTWDKELAPLSLLRYQDAKGFYVAHIDDSPGNPRAFSALVYMNDVPRGGETYFTEFGIGIQPKAGDIAVFPASYPYQHEARMPLEGEKFVLVTFMPRHRKS